MVSTKGSLFYDMGESVFGVGYANLEKTSGPCFLLGPCIGQIIQAEYPLSAVPLEKEFNSSFSKYTNQRVFWLALISVLITSPSLEEALSPEFTKDAQGTMSHGMKLIFINSLTCGKPMEKLCWQNYLKKSKLEMTWLFGRLPSCLVFVFFFFTHVTHTDKMNKN